MLTSVVAFGVARCAVFDGDTSLDRVVEELAFGTVAALGDTRLTRPATGGERAITQTARSALPIFFIFKKISFNFKFKLNSKRQAMY